MNEQENLKANQCLLSNDHQFFCFKWMIIIFHFFFHLAENFVLHFAMYNAIHVSVCIIPGIIIMTIIIPLVSNHYTHI